MAGGSDCDSGSQRHPATSDQRPEAGDVWGATRYHLALRLNV
jgi:hypothetical protein